MITSNEIDATTDRVLDRHHVMNTPHHSLSADDFAIVMKTDRLKRQLRKMTDYLLSNLLQLLIYLTPLLFEGVPTPRH